jgi:DNA-binding MarR family transcriptional regulator
MSELEHPIRKLVEISAGIHIRTKRWAERRLRSYNMTYPQYGALSVLYSQPGLCQRELAEALQAVTTTAMVLCDALERKGWLKRRVDPRDRRTNRLELTADGDKAYKLARPDIEAGFAEVSIALSNDEAQAALKPLEKLYTRISEISAEKRKR